MEGVLVTGAAVRPQTFLQGITSSPVSASSTTEASLSHFHLPSTPYDNGLRRFRNAGSKLSLRHSSSAIVVAKLDTGDALAQPRRGRKFRASSVAAPAADIIELDKTTHVIDNIYRESLSARLENAYRQPPFELLVSDLDAKILGDIKDVDIKNDRAMLPSSGAPKVVRKRAAGRPKVAGDQIVRISKNISRRRPGRGLSKELKEPMETTKMVEELVEDVGGKRRLSLMSRIAMKKNRQEKLQKHGTSSDVDFENLCPDDQNLWSPEAEELISKYSTSLDLTAPMWEKLDRGLLKADEECALANRMKPMKRLEKVRNAVGGELGRNPTDEEWASAANMKLSTLRRQLSVCRAARTKLIQHNLRLVLSQGHKYYKESMSLSLHDLCQEGAVGLMHAVDKFDPNKGYRFSTYGVYWIRNSILRAQTKSGHMMRSPVNVSMHRVNIKRITLELTMELGRPPTNEEIMEHSGLAADRFRDIVRTNMRVGSLHERDRVTGREVVENLVDSEDASTAVANNTSMLRYGMDDVLDSLRPRENMVLRQRFGLDGKGERSLAEVGFNLNLSREMVRRYELRGLLRMQHPTRVDYLRNYLA